MKKIIVNILFTLSFCLCNAQQEANTTPETFKAIPALPKPCSSQLPLKLPPRETQDPNQRFGEPVKLRAERKFIIQTGESHKSNNNIVAVYIGLPTADTAQDNVVIEKVHSDNANPANIIFSPQKDSVMVEYFNVPQGFKDEIAITFSLDLYRRRVILSQSKVKPHDKQNPLYIKYTKSSTEEPEQKLQKHLKLIKISPQESPLINAKKIYNYLGKKLSYGHYSPDETVPEDILDGGKAHCGIYATLFTNLCRQSGIPARRCAGFLLGMDPNNSEHTTVAAHNWAEFYVEGIGWIPVDPIMGDKNDSRNKYYFGNMDNAHLCISKGGYHDQLPIWYKTSASGDILFTDNLDDFRPDLHPDTIQGAHRLQYRWDQPIQISVLNSYGAENMTVLSREGEIKLPKTH